MGRLVYTGWELQTVASPNYPAGEGQPVSGREEMRTRLKRHTKHLYSRPSSLLVYKIPW
jgi:hypothetical protein